MKIFTTARSATTFLILKYAIYAMMKKGEICDLRG